MTGEDAIIDTNVLIVASLASSKEVDLSHRTPEECMRVFEWLEIFGRGEAALVLDNGFTMFDEYNNKLTGQDFGLLVVAHKLQTHWRLHEIEHEEVDGAARIPPEFEALDRSDRKFLAVALADLEAGHASAIINATDTDDWREIEAPCQERGVVVRHLLDD